MFPGHFLGPKPCFRAGFLDPGRNRVSRPTFGFQANFWVSGQLSGFPANFLGFLDPGMDSWFLAWIPGSWHGFLGSVGKLPKLPVATFLSDLRRWLPCYESLHRKPPGGFMFSRQHVWFQCTEQLLLVKQLLSFQLEGTCFDGGFCAQ